MLSFWLRPVPGHAPQLFPGGAWGPPQQAGEATRLGTLGHEVPGLLLLGGRLMLRLLALRDPAERLGPDLGEQLLRYLLLHAPTS